MRRIVTFFLPFLFAGSLGAQSFSPSSDRPPNITREFRGAWVACVYNLDWPSAKGLSAGQQQAELRAILERMASLHMNSIIFQVRPNCDAVYASSREPWSPWISGAMGRSPGYDPLAFCIREAHARGIEVHAWFNPFRALAGSSLAPCASHVMLASPGITKHYGGSVWCDPAQPEARSRALGAILDVVRRYDVDGVHLDDYFYPYPQGHSEFPDGRSPAERRSVVDGFVHDLYGSVKREKQYVRVGISPFGIWRPGVPSGIEAGLDAYEQLGCDSRKWLRNGWVDYLAPQLYWRISPEKQSYSNLLTWWRSQGSRPVWPGIATERIQSKDDPGRPASEIINQIQLARTSGNGGVGHIHWSAKSLMTNRGGISTKLQSVYSQDVLPPPMPWLSTQAPKSPACSAGGAEGGIVMNWQGDPATSKVAIQARSGGVWRTVKVLPASARGARIANADAVALTAVDRFGNTSAPTVLSRK
jgi:uncharacterized lipoprotein YddW (UPF0748 family)